MSNDNASLESYGAITGFSIHCTDSDPSEILLNFDDTSQVEKYTISNEDYYKRENNFKKFKQKMLAQNPNFMSQNTIPAEF